MEKEGSERHVQYFSNPLQGSEAWFDASTLDSI